MSEDKFSRCPKGHKLPRANGAGQQCLPAFCAGIKKREKKTHLGETRPADEVVAGGQLNERGLASLGRELSQELTVNEGNEDIAKEALAAQLRQADERLAGHIARRKYLNVPELRGKAAEEWADQELVALLPDAVAELKWQLKFGTPAERAQAARDVREATGRGKRELQAAAGPAIVIQLAPGQTLQMPGWAKRVDAPALSTESTSEEK